MVEAADRDMRPSEVNALASAFALAALLRRMVERGLLTEADVIALMTEARENAEGSSLRETRGDFSLRAVLSALVSIEGLATLPPPPAKPEA